MPYVFWFVLLVIGTTLAQTALVPALLPPVLRPDLGILLGIVVLAFGPRNYGLVLLFALGVQADLFGSPRLGMLTLSYLLAAGLMLWVVGREIARGDMLTVWLAAVGGTLVAHMLFLCIAGLSGFELSWGVSLARLASLVIAACVFGLPLTYACGRAMYRLGIVTGGVRERWTSEDRIAAARKGRLSRR